MIINKIIAEKDIYTYDFELISENLTKPEQKLMNLEQVGILKIPQVFLNSILILNRKKKMKEKN